MEAIGQKFIATIGRGKVPEGGRLLRSFSEYGPVELAEARRGFDTVRLLDNAPQDEDRRPGHMAGGVSNREISETCFLSLHTVKWHNQKILRKLGVTNRRDATALWRQESESASEPAKAPSA